jgi:hypothetical protein
VRLLFTLPYSFSHERLRALFEELGRSLEGAQGAFTQSSERGEGNPYDGYVHHHTASLTLPNRTLRASDSTMSSTFSTLELRVDPCTGAEWLTLRELLRRELGAEHDCCLRPWIVSEVVPTLEIATAIALARESLAGADSTSPGCAELKAWLAGNEPVMNPSVGGWAESDEVATRVNELEDLLRVIRNSAACLVNFDMWDARASSFATPEESAQMHAEAEQARREDDQAKAAIEALIIKTRAEVPAALNAWIDKHDTYLAEFIAERVARGEDWAVLNEKEARANWAEVREGKRNVHYWFGAWPSDQERYLRIFGRKP